SFAEFPRVGLRLDFATALSPYAYLCKNEQLSSASRNPYILYAFTVSGVAYLIRLTDDITGYGSCSVLPPNEVVELDVTSYCDYGAITAIAATNGCLIIGGQDGSVGCFRLGMLDSTSPGARFSRLWAGGTTNDNNVVPLAVLLKPNLEAVGEMISLYNLHLNLGGKTNLSVDPSTMNISVEESVIIDVKLSSNKIWILKEDGLVVHNVLGPSESREFEQCFGLQESFVAEQLFQSSEHAADDLFWLAHSLYPSAKEQMVSRVTSIFLRMLFLPDVYHNSVLRATLQDHNRHFTDSEFHSLTADAMKKEIISVIEHEGVSRSPLSLLYGWKNFCSHYVDNWCNKNGPCGLLLDSSTGAIGLIRKSSVSLLRCLEDIELLAFGCFDELGEVANSKINLSSNLEREVLFEVLRCTSSLSQQLGKGAAVLFYQSFFSQPSISPEEVVGSFLKVLETRCTSSTAAALHVSELGVDAAWDKGVGDHKFLRKFSTDIFLSLHGLYRKAATWDKVLDVILKYLNFLVPQKTENKSDDKPVLDIRTCLTVQVTSQVAKVMFESALDILLLLSYMMKLGGQINMLPEDVSRVQQELFPLIQEIITEWHIIHFFGTTPCEAPTMEDFSSQLSLLQIDNSATRRSWNDKLGKCDFSLAFIFLLDHQNSFEGVVSRQLPDPNSLIVSVHNFTSWIVWGRSEDESSSFSTRSTMLALILLKHGQFDAVEHLLTMVNQNLLKEKISSSIQDVNNEWCILLHLLGCCLLAQAHRQAPRISTEKKAERSDVSIKPNPYKLLYAFEMHQHNWRKAAIYMYLHSAQLKNEAALKDSQLRSLALQERLNCLSATINALHLVRKSSAWINPILEGKSIQNPSKKARITIPEQEADDNLPSQKPDSCMDIEKLEKEFVLTSAEYLLSLANVRWTYDGLEKPPPNLVELLVHSNLYDMVFTVILKFFKGSALKRELERVFIAMSLKCCPSRENSKKNVLLLTSSKDEAVHDSFDIAHYSKGNDQWEALEQYIEKYKCFHPRLPVLVAETLLCADRLIELPIWLVQMFKGTFNGRWGMAGSESSPASLFQLYVDYGRYAEATNLLLHYIESVSSL
ncbi:hypothetical protein M8C21_024531, partial [Ambrosia artemisiifolia]